MLLNGIELGGHYICTAPEGVACVWDPGTYPAYWEKQE